MGKFWSGAIVTSIYTNEIGAENSRRFWGNNLKICQEYFVAILLIT